MYLYQSYTHNIAIIMPTYNITDIFYFFTLLTFIKRYFVYLCFNNYACVILTQISRYTRFVYHFNTIYSKAAVNVSF